MRRLVAADVTSHVNIADRFQSRPFGEAPGQKHLAQFKVRVISQVGFETIPKHVCLPTQIDCVVALKVHLLVGELSNL